MADLVEGRHWAPTLIWVKKEEITEGRKVSRASKSNPPPPPTSLSSIGLDLPLHAGFRSKFEQ